MGPPRRVIAVNGRSVLRNAGACFTLICRSCTGEDSVPECVHGTQPPTYREHRPGPAMFLSPTHPWSGIGGSTGPRRVGSARPSIHHARLSVAGAHEEGPGFVLRPVSSATTPCMHTWGPEGHLAGVDAAHGYRRVVMVGTDRESRLPAPHPRRYIDSGAEIPSSPSVLAIV